MINQEIQNEVEANRKIIIDAPNDPYLDNESVLTVIEQATRRMLDLAKLALGENEVDYALEVIAEAKSYAKQICEFSSGMSMRELNDYVIAHTDIKDTKYELYWECVLEETPYIFESFMFFMEKNRPFAKKFYEPRRYNKNGKPALKIVADALQGLENREYDFLGISQPARTGKLIADYTPVLTKDGWKTHGDLKVGDYVVGLHGEWVKVTYVHPKFVANKRVTFSDGSHIDCHENHEWLVYDKNCQHECVVETKQMAKTLTVENGKRLRYYLPLKEVVEGQHKELPVDPYVFGAWLGDGNTTKPDLTICNTDLQIVNAVIEKGYNISRIYQQVGCNRYAFNGLRVDLQKLGLCASHTTIEKFIPEEYLTADVEQRLELLAGLLDTDGNLRLEEHRYAFSTINENLKDGLVELISSFGWRVCCIKYDAKTSSSGIKGKHDVYVISFNPDLEIPCRVPRKQLKTFSKQRRLGVENIEDITPVSGNCITVEGGIYRVGKRFIPTHNSSICIFYLCWKSLRHPNDHNAMIGHSGVLVKGFFKEVLNLMTSTEYTYQEIYTHYNPTMTLIRDKSAEDFTITLGDPDRFATVTCRGIDATLTGAVDVSRNGVLYIDDLVRDREHSLSPTRMESTFQDYLNKCVDRKQDGAQELIVGTLWNVLDPLERLSKMYADNPRYKFLRLPALDENDESNFDYVLNGFPTEYYKDMRSRLDNAEWQAKYQQRPFVREGLVFPENELKFFDGLVKIADIKRVFAVVDPSVGGGDNTSCPICYEMNDGRKLIVSWIFDKRTINFTIPRVASAITRHTISEIRIEKNGVGILFLDKTQEYVKQNDIVGCVIKGVNAPNRMSKEDKINGYSDTIKRDFYFLPPKCEIPDNEVPEGYILFKRDADYQNAMDGMAMYTSEGRNVFDDSPDSMAQLAIMCQAKKNGQINVIHMPDGFGI